MFIQKAFVPGNTFWKYMLGTLLVFLAMLLGQVPMVIAMQVHSMNTGEPLPMTDTAVYNYLDRNATLFYMLLTFVTALAALLLVVKLLHKQKLKDIITSRPRVDWKRVFFAFFIWAVFSLATTAIDYFSNPADYVVQFNPGAFLILAVIGILMIPLQTSLEELLFRGYLMQGFGLLAKNRWVPLVVTSVFFGLLHILNPEVEKMGYFIIIYYIGTGFLLGIITLMDEGNELTLGFHAANNLVAALLVTADWTAFQTDSVLKDVSEPSAGFDVLVPVLVIYPLLLLLFAKVYKWSNWKEKLTGKVLPKPVIITEETDTFDTRY
ncbi:CPBP family intramembrane glutamic endopeptidase [Flavobacterium rhizosphaerae]|uniref:Type II CAAX endopeptidase family protein n=1 Tax=Flavobacterium rhizosphaerae TaxID=3163298 RepID=A0ABW8YWQ3_9FLAO